MTLHGPSYPSPSSSGEPIPQSFTLALHCATDASEQKFKSYDGAQVVVEWSTPAGCGFKDDTNSPNDDNETDGGEGGGSGGNDKVEESVGSGIGWFFLV